MTLSLYHQSPESSQKHGGGVRLIVGNKTDLEFVERNPQGTRKKDCTGLSGKIEVPVAKMKYFEPPNITRENRNQIVSINQ